MSSPMADTPDPIANIPPDVLARLRRETKRPEAYAVIIVFTLLGFTFYTLRAYTRFVMLRNHGWEDYLVTVAMICSIGMAVSQILQHHAGAGLHQVFLSVPEIILMLKYLFASILFYFTSCTFTKISILFQYHRLFVGKTMKRAVNVAIGIIILYGIYTLVTNIWTCIPISAFWDITNTSAKCLPKFPMWYANAALNVLTEIMIATLPLRTVYKLKLPQSQRYALMCIFGLGYCVCLISIMRLYSLVMLSRNMHDSTWYSPEPAYWSAVETNLGIICACLPAIKPLIVRFVPRFGSGSISTGGSANSHGNGNGIQRSNTIRMGPTSFSSMSSTTTKNGSVDGIKVTLTTIHDSDAWVSKDDQRLHSEVYSDVDDKKEKEYV